MGTFRHEQRRLNHRGKVFHFVSYDAQDANPARKVVEMPVTWYLVSSGNRWPAIPFQAGQVVTELDACLTEWLEGHVFA